MATSGSVTTNAYSNRSLTFSWSRVSYSIENNTTTISWTLRGSGSQSQWFMSGPFLVKINGAQQYYSSNRIQLSNGTTVASGTYTVQHDSVGWGAFTVYIEGAIYSYSVNVSASQQFVMETIPRATTPSVSGTLKMGNTVTINLPRASSSFTHIVTYSFGSIWRTISENAGASVQWTIPRDLATQIPNGLTGTLYISAQTKNSSGTVIGTKQISVTLQVSDSDVPSITSVSHSENVSGLATQFGFYIQYKSRLNVSIGASGIYGSTIKSYSVSFDGSTYSGSSFVTNYISQSGNMTMTISVTDSRGRTASTTRTIAVTAYAGLSISSLTAKRVDSSSADDEEEGTYLKVAYAFSIPSLSNKNTKSYKLEYKTQAGTSWTTLQTGSVYSANTTFISTSGILDVDQSYTIRLTIYDYFGNTSAPYDVSVAFVLVDYHSSGRGMSVGKVAENADLFDVALKSRFRDKVQIDSALTIPTSIKEGMNVPIAGSVDSSPDLYGEIKAKPSFIGSIQTDGDGWLNVLSVRHRNGSGDGGDYGMVLYTSLTSDSSSLAWNQQIGSVWKGNRVLLDSKNYSGYFGAYVKETGFSGIWRYRKWNNGIAECWGTWTGSINTGANNYSGYYYSDSFTVNYPSGLFNKVPQLMVDRGPTNFMGFARAFGDTQTYARFCIGAHGAYTQTVDVYMYAIGQWG